MTFDFENAATRHYKDAEFLYADNRWANADQLYGLSAECILKCVITGLCPTDVNADGDFVNPSNPRKKSPHKKHLGNGGASDTNGLWNYFSTSFSGRLSAHITFPATNLFLDWDVAQRYHHDRGFTQSDVEQHRLGAQETVKESPATTV